MEPGDILSAIFLTNAVERETFILLVCGLFSALVSVAWTGSDSLSAPLPLSLSFVLHLALLFFSSLLHCRGVKSGCVQTAINTVSEKLSLLVRTQAAASVLQGSHGRGERRRMQRHPTTSLLWLSSAFVMSSSKTEKRTKKKKEKRVRT